MGYWGTKEQILILASNRLLPSTHTSFTLPTDVSYMRSSDFIPCLTWLVSKTSQVARHWLAHNLNAIFV